MAAYPISTPVTFTGGAVIDFNSATIREFANTAGSTGALVYRDGSANMIALAIGSASDVLTVTGGVPVWAVPSANAASVLAYGTAAAVGIPTGDTWTTFANSGTNYITWSTAAPGNDAGSSFNTTTGIYTVPATGIYQVSAMVHYTASNIGAGTIVTPPTGTASRQLRIFKSNAAPFTVALSTRQAEASISNPTYVYIPGTNISLTAADTLVLQGRQDSGSALTLDVVQGQTYFSVHRVS
jgi:hypothetical protein